MYCGKRIILDINDAEDDSDAEANNADHCDNDLEHPVKPKGIEESKEIDAEGKEDDKGAPEGDGMEHHERTD